MKAKMDRRVETEHSCKQLAGSGVGGLLEDAMERISQGT